LAVRQADQAQSRTARIKKVMAVLAGDGDFGEVRPAQRFYWRDEVGQHSLESPQIFTGNHG